MRLRSRSSTAMLGGRHRAFSLTEIIASIVIMAVAIPPMLWGLRTANAHQVSHTLASRARWLATERLEDIIADRHSSTRGYAYLTPGNYPAEGTINGFPGFSRRISVTETGPDLVTVGTGYKLITCTVEYLDGAGQPREFSISTVLTDYTP